MSSQSGRQAPQTSCALIPYLTSHVPVTLNGEPGYYQTVGRDGSVTHANTMLSQRKGHHGRPGHYVLVDLRIDQRYSPMTLARVSWIGARQWGRDSSDAHATSRLTLKKGYQRRPSYSLQE